MLKILNELAPFFEDCYRRIGVREYAKIIGVSPPTAAKVLRGYRKNGLLEQGEQYGRLLFSARRESRELVDLSRQYWRVRLTPLIAALEKVLADPTAVLFGSLAKGEVRPESDIDLAVFNPVRKPIDLAPFKKRLCREISMHWFPTMAKVPNPNLRNNILNGYILAGKLRWE